MTATCSQRMQCMSRIKPNHTRKNPGFLQRQIWMHNKNP